VELGGAILKSPYDTYYSARQAVLADPEGNVFRVNHRVTPRRPASEIENPPWA
jgi:predicted enzyme related to lactoylglutathione lyase